MNKPGKFEGCANQDLAERLYELECDDDLGDVADFGWYGLIKEFNGKAYIISEDNYGFMDYTEYELNEILPAWDKLQAEYSEFMDEIED